jgi:hypothetical protein
VEIEILNMISNASINGYYDPSLGLVVVWFHNVKDDKPDLVAYLMPGMNWDLREVVSEESELFVDEEVIKIKHSPIEVFEKDSSFDQTVRKILNQVIDHSSKEGGGQSPRLEMMKVVLDNNSYHSVRN